MGKAMKWMDGWMDGWTDGWMYIYIYTQYIYIYIYIHITDVIFFPAEKKVSDEGH